MTTAPTNEMLALADEYAAKAKLKWPDPSDVHKYVLIENALRLAATPARDVREALEYALGSLRTIAGGWRNSSPGQLGAIAQAGIDLAELGPEKCAEMRGEASNLDAAAPAAGGDVEPVAWQWRYVGNKVWNTPSGGKKQNQPAHGRQIEQRPLYAAPPLQAPSHSDAVREALEDAEASFEFIRLKLISKLEEPERSAFWRAIEAREKCRAALTAPAAKAPAVSEADVGAAEIAGLVTAAAKVIADWSADCKVDDDSIVLLLTAYNAMKPCGVLLLNEVESAIQSAAQGGGTELESQAKATEGKAGMAVGTPHVRQTTAGTGLRVGEAGAVQPATSEFMDVTAGETAPFPSDPPSQEASAPDTKRPNFMDREAVKRAICKSRTCEGIRCCQWPCNGGRWHDSRQQPGPCRVEEGRYDDAANEVLALIDEGGER